jgi:pyruvate dehydrogenase E2 component (dihydrolipoamide acetyltransferase)
MPKDFKLPNLGEGVDGGDVIDVLVGAGDQVAGRVAKLHVKKGDHAEVGQILVTFEDGAAAPAAEKRPARAAAPQPAVRPEKATEKEPPQPPENAAPRPAPTPSMSPEAAVAEEARGTPAAPASAAALAAATGEPTAAGPSTRRLARELGVDLHQVPGTGPGGRITEDDVKAYVRAQLAAGPATPGGGGRIAVPPLADFAQWGPIKREPLSSLRRKTAEQVALAWALVPHVTQFDLADVTELERYRKRHAVRAEARGAKLTMTAIVIKAAAIALKAFPRFNSSLDTRSNELILKQYYHIGVAVDTERGLIVPVLRDADKKDVLEIAVALSELAARTRDKKIGVEELRGATFTVTNLGGIGGTGFSPIIHWPEVAILGLARARQESVVRDGAAEPRWMLPLCLSYDHRVIDGADAARFARRIAEMLEDPFVMLLGG